MMMPLNVSDKQSTDNDKSAPSGHRTWDNGIGVHPWMQVKCIHKQRKKAMWMVDRISVSWFQTRLLIWQVLTIQTEIFEWQWWEQWQLKNTTMGNNENNNNKQAWLAFMVCNYSFSAENQNLWSKPTIMRYGRKKIWSDQQSLFTDFWPKISVT
jgi:hypothetical protein